MPAIENVYTGAYGKLVILPADELDAPVVIGHEPLGLADSAAVARVTDVEICVRTKLAEFHEIGRRHPVTLHPGNIHISGKIGRAFINGGLLFLLLGRGAAVTEVNEIDNPYPQPHMQLQLTHSDPAVPGTSIQITINDVMFDSWWYNMPEDDFVVQNVTFKARRIYVQGFVDDSAQDVSFEG